jgi:hypothetical protein
MRPQRRARQVLELALSESKIGIGDRIRHACGRSPARLVLRREFASI